MKKQHLFITLFSVLTLISSTLFAGDGTVSNPFTVCKGSQFKLTSNTYANPTTFTWVKLSGAATGTSATSVSGSNVQGTYLISTTAADAAGDTLRYSLYVQSADGCISATQTFYVRVVDPAINLNLGAETNDAYCAEVITGSQSINLVASSPNAGYTIPNNTFSWSVSPATATVVNTDAATTTGTVPAIAGSYTFTVNTLAVTDIAPAGGCVANASVTVDVDPTPAAPTVTISSGE